MSILKQETASFKKNPIQVQTKNSQTSQIIFIWFCSEIVQMTDRIFKAIIQIEHEIGTKNQCSQSVCCEIEYISDTRITCRRGGVFNTNCPNFIKMYVQEEDEI